MKPQGTTNEGTQGLFTGIVPAKCACLRDLRRRMPIFTKNATFPMT